MSTNQSISKLGLPRWINERPWMEEPFEPGDFPNYDDWRHYRTNINPATKRPYTVTELANLYGVTRDSIYKWIMHDQVN